MTGEKGKQVQRHRGLAHLKDEFGAAKVGLLLLPEVVGFDDEGHMDLGGKGFLQCFEQGLDEVPLGAPHVDDDGEATFAYVLTVGEGRDQARPSRQLRL